jgi:hypothetical protein
VFIHGVAGDETREGARRAWVEAVVTAGRQAFKAASESVGSHADALRKRVEGQTLCGAWLGKERKDVLGESAKAEV